MTLQLPTGLQRGAPILALSLALAACGGAASDNGVVSLQDPSASPNPSAAPAASMDPEEAMLAFQKCMKEHGVEIQMATVVGGGGPGDGAGGLHVGGDTKGDDPQNATGPLDPKAMEAAEKACHDLLPAGGMLGDPNATMDPAMADQMLAFARCMRDHGVDFPDPVLDGGGVSVQIGGPDGGGGIDPTSRVFQAAQEACAKDMPGGGPFVVGGSSSESKP